MPGVLDRALVGVLPAVPRPVVRWVAQRYIAGDSLADACRVVATLNAAGKAATIDVLGEAVESREESSALVAEYLDALDSIADRGLDADISVKLTGLGLSLDHALCRENLIAVTEAAAGCGNRVEIDMEDSSTTAETLAIYRELREAGHENLGIVLQATLKRTIDDAFALADLRPAVRVCKGIYVEPPEVAYAGREAIRFNFAKTVETLLAGGSFVAIATHDESLVEGPFVSPRSTSSSRSGTSSSSYSVSSPSSETGWSPRGIASASTCRTAGAGTSTASAGCRRTRRSRRASRSTPLVASFQARSGMVSRAYLAIACVFVTALVLSNIVAVKIVEVAGRQFDAGTILFPVTYLIGDVVTEVYGYRSARRLIWLGFGCNVLAVGVIQIAIHLPSAGFWDANQSAYETVLGTTWRIFVGSLAAYLVGEFVNSYILAKMKIATSGRWLWSRTITSSVAGQALDSIVFSTIAFAGTGIDLWNQIVTIWVLKVLWEIAATPLTYWVVNTLKRREGSDVYDTDTNFNPLDLRA